MLNLKGKKVWVTGGSGLVGSAIQRRLVGNGIDSMAPDRSYLDLTDPCRVQAFVAAKRPDITIHCAAKVGGMYMNIEKPAQFIHDCVRMDTAVIDASRNMQAIVYMGSICAYPYTIDPPFSETDFMKGPPEPSNEAYAVAKITGITMATAYHQQYGLPAMIPMPCNVYGPGDRSDHVIPSLIERMHEAKCREEDSVDIWGAGQAVREFIYVEDLVDRLMALFDKAPADCQLWNIGSGQICTIAELAETIREVVGFRGRLNFRSGYNQGIPVKTINTDKAESVIGKIPTTGLAEGLLATYLWMYP